MAVCVGVALAMAFFLQLDQPSWAGTSAVLVCQPVLGSSLRKGLYRLLGTVVGAGATMLLFAAFPQDRVGFTFGLAGWCALCAFVGSQLTFFAAYGAVLAGYTAVILAGDLVDNPDRTFDVALARTAAILLGVAVATIVLGITQPREGCAKLAAALRGLAIDAVSVLLTFMAACPEPPVAGVSEVDDKDADCRVRALLARLDSLDAKADQATGEAWLRRFPLGTVRAGQDGLFACIAEAERLRHDGRWRYAALPPPADGLPDTASAAAWRSLADSLLHAARETPVPAPVMRAADALRGAAAALDAAEQVGRPEGPCPLPVSRSRDGPTDPWPALVNAARAFACVVVVSTVWMATRWPNGPGAITFASVVVLLMGPQWEKAAGAASGFLAGMLVTACLAGVTEFALLPMVQTMGGLSLTLAVTLIPLAALSTVPRLTPVLAPAMMNFLPFVSPTNEMRYDTMAFYNSGLAILTGSMVAAVALRVIAPLPPAIRTRRVVAAAEAEFAAVVAGTWRPSAGSWTGRMRTRAAGLADSASPDAARVLLMFSRGMDAIRPGRPAPSQGGQPC